MSNGSKRIIIQYTDLAGFLRSIETNYSGNEIYATFDGSSVSGFADIERSDLLAIPDPSTIKEIPWQNNYLRSIGRIYTPEKERFSRDPRYVAEKTINYLRDLGYEALVGAEIELFLFRKVVMKSSNPATSFSQKLLLLERSRFEKNYHEPDHQNKTFLFRDKVIEYMRDLGYEVENSHHEVASSQIEISLAAGDIVRVGDAVVTLKWVSRRVGGELGVKPVFMPKPVYGMSGSGMHIHISLWRDSENLFSSSDGLSNLARYFIGGLIEHCRSLAAIAAPTTNSYKRLVPGYEAPTYCAWGFYNRSLAIRIPIATNPSKTRIEFRVPDPSSNPYLAISATILAGLDGVKKRIDPGQSLSENAYEISLEEAKRRGIETTPRSLREALEELVSDNDYLKPVFTRDLLERYVEIKEREIREIETRPHQHEYLMYLEI